MARSISRACLMLKVTRRMGEGAGAAAEAAERSGPRIEGRRGSANWSPARTPLEPTLLRGRRLPDRSVFGGAIAGWDELPEQFPQEQGP